MPGDPSCLVWPESEGCAEVLDCHYLDRERNPPLSAAHEDRTVLQWSPLYGLRVTEEFNDISNPVIL